MGLQSCLSVTNEYDDEFWGIKKCLLYKLLLLDVTKHREKHSTPLIIVSEYFPSIFLMTFLGVGNFATRAREGLLFFTITFSQWGFLDVFKETFPTMHSPLYPADCALLHLVYRLLPPTPLPPSKKKQCYCIQKKIYIKSLLKVALMRWSLPSYIQHYL